MEMSQTKFDKELEKVKLPYWMGSMDKIKHNKNIAVKQPVVTAKKKHPMMLFIKIMAQNVYCTEIIGPVKL